MNSKKILTSFLILVMAGFSGCRTVESTARFYKNMTNSPLPPKPPGTVVPIMKAEETRRTYKVIGEMEFETGGSDRFIMESIQYNARIHGADAVIMQTWEKEKETYVDWQPGFEAHVGFTHHYRDPGFCWTHYYDYPRYETYTYINNKIRAEMILFLDKETFGSIGLLFENVRNANYLEVGEVLPGSPAEKAGICRGDKITQIGDYLCNKGLEDYFQQGPVYSVGKTFVIKLLNGDKEISKNVVAEKIKELPPIPQAKIERLSVS